MPLSWNEIKHRAIAFSNDWKDETREDAEAKSFWDAFFLVFGVPRRTVASFEEPVKKLTGDWAYIDLFWPRTMLAEHKSAGKDLGKAHAQGMEYIRALVDSGRAKDVPRYLVVSDFQRIATLDQASVPSTILATASFPCNDLSLAGARKGLAGEHSSAFWGFIRILREMGARRPPLVLLENVTGFLTSHDGADFHEALRN